MMHVIAEVPAGTRFPSEGTVGVLPLGSTEAHGPHLPLQTDSIIVEGLLDATAERLVGDRVTALRLPLMPVGVSEEHLASAGTESVTAEQFMAAIAATGARLAGAGVSRIVFVNGHGGNVSAANIAALRLRRNHGMLAANLHWLDLGLPADFDPPTSIAADVHGGWIETSVIMHLRPDLVSSPLPPARPARPPAAILFPTGPVAWGWEMADLGGADFGGQPDLARADIGARLVAHAASALARTIEEFALAPWPPAAAPRL
ncbi:MAG: creatininase family protein [Alphaproteobacteria bacterium]